MLVSSTRIQKIQKDFAQCANVPGAFVAWMERFGPELSSAATLAAEFEKDCTDAEKLEYSSWSERGGLLKLREQLARTLIEQL